MPNSECIACGGTGINSKGGVCVPCENYDAANTPYIPTPRQPRKEEEQLVIEYTPPIPKKIIF